MRSELTHRRCIALQLGDKYRITTPVNWKTGDDVIVHPSVNNEEAKTLFPDVTFHKVGVLPAAAEVSKANEWTLHSNRTSGRPRSSRETKLPCFKDALDRAKCDRRLRLYL